jgi:hypothetical protein
VGIGCEGLAENPAGSLPVGSIGDDPLLQQCVGRCRKIPEIDRFRFSSQIHDTHSPTLYASSWKAGYLTR